MPSSSKSQQRLMGMSYAVKKGDMKLSDIDAAYRDEVKNLVDTMTLKELKDFASTSHTDLPEDVKESLSTEIEDFFKANPSPSDKQVHALADKLGMEADDLEAEIYKIVGKHVSEESDDVKETTIPPTGSLNNVMGNMLKGMGPITLPGVDNQNTGYGDIIAAVGDANDVYDKRLKKKKKKKKKKRNVLTSEQFLNEQEQLKAFKPVAGKGESLGVEDYEHGPANDPDVEEKEKLKAKRRMTNIVGYSQFGSL